MSGTVVTDPPPESPTHRVPSMAVGDKVRLVLRGIGQTLITAGLVILLFVVYEVYITNVFAHREQVTVHNKLEKEWAQNKDPLPLPGAGKTVIPIGEGIANMYVPRLGKDYAFTIVEGTDDASLEKGPGHYVATALPGEIGNFSVAGHRVGKGEPFLNLDRLKPGDAVIVETKTDWYVYRVKGREIVSPSDGQVISPVPNSPGARPTEKLMTMTTCHPKFTATQRMVVHAALEARRTVPKTGSGMPAPISGLYDEAGI